MSTTTKIALVTGANKGLGFETVKQLAEKGIKVILTARDVKKGEEATQQLKAKGLDVTFFKLDTSSSDDIQKVKEYLEKNYGKLDILINNAGLIQGEGWGDNSVETVSIADIRRTFDVNFFGVVELTQALLPLIKKSAAGRIVNLSSIMGSLELHSKPNSPIYNSKPFGYDASKTALNQFTVHLAHALKDTNIKVNSAHPGWVKTELGTDYAPMNVIDGAKTGVKLALLDDNGTTGGYIHLGQSLPW
jgi:NAD(P)-dependent dehydrogenase (short-subunit alcohol dehydrogenase family)